MSYIFPDDMAQDVPGNCGAHSLCEGSEDQLSKAILGAN